MRAGKRRAQGGFSYVVVMALVAILGIGLAAVGPLWAEESRREREDELLRVGRLYAEALANYYKASPGSARRYPMSLQELLSDSRFVGTRRHLRALYPDPVGGQPWGLVRAADGGIRGVFSQSQAQPLRRVSVALGPVVLPPAETYLQWQFVARVDE